MTAVESVQCTARCDGGCGGDARWSGVPAAYGGGTIYRIICGVCDVENSERENAAERQRSSFTPLPIVAASWQWLLGRGRVA